MKFWYKRIILSYILLPFSALFWLVSQVRRQLFAWGLLKSYKATLPVIVVGNLSVGGNGKTPFTLWLVQQLRARDMKVGIISRGYGAKSKTFPLLVTAQSDPKLAGDEPVLLAHRTGVPVCISPNRQHSIELLQRHYDLDIIISDDGLQHYKLQRDIEIVVMDAVFGLGNGFLLPAGPLRELPSRLREVDFVVTNGALTNEADVFMRLVPLYAVNLLTQEQKTFDEFEQINAIAGIGNPTRFFNMLRQELGLALIVTQAFQDHQEYTAGDFKKFSQNRPLFMTEKDAVKCRGFAQENWWYVPVQTEIVGDTAKLFTLIESIKASKHES
ncbi:tetraacyldisaccharide 4'-kinase [Conservatibacter flavescens]|uniref:Tetraacyldisaccharide 4'-kinase n=1 Tax=Conservatibacter flavescens TaxID=28161 RepID=A0A2M8S417_9PAST|nr:tetraacyldisaccharide 4'-kinase [Conservatibacter flavescens]PJG85867.1 tetraacyldisaccharide 4'-kinase [Conservatibacter flavescens]